MEALILAAGYGTRLFRDARLTPWEELVRSCPKPLLSLGKYPLLTHSIAYLLRGRPIDRVVVVTNQRDRDAFRQWRRGLGPMLSSRIELLHDPTHRNEERMGAMGDLRWACQQGLETTDGLLVMAGDILLVGDGPGRWIAHFKRTRVTHLLVERAPPERIRGRSGCVCIGGDGKVLAYREKPQVPLWPWAAIPVYIYARDTLDLLPFYVQEGGELDAPGSWFPWLLRQGIPVRALSFQGRRLDCGRLVGYLGARSRFHIS